MPYPHTGVKGSSHERRNVSDIRIIVSKLRTTTGFPEKSLDSLDLWAPGSVGKIGDDWATNESDAVSVCCRLYAFPLYAVDEGWSSRRLNSRGNRAGMSAVVRPDEYNCRPYRVSSEILDRKTAVVVSDRFSRKHFIGHI